MFPLPGFDNFENYELKIVNTNKILRHRKMFMVPYVTFQMEFVW